MLGFEFVNIGWCGGGDEVLEAASVVEVKMTDYYGFDVGDGVARGGDGRGGGCVLRCRLCVGRGRLFQRPISGAE